jgi:hypothetical protein
MRLNKKSRQLTGNYKGGESVGHEDSSGWQLLHIATRMRFSLRSIGLLRLDVQKL